MKWRIKKSVLAMLKIDSAPYALAGKDEGPSYLIRGDHPHYEQLRQRVHKNGSVGAPKQRLPNILPWYVAMWAEFHVFCRTTNLRMVAEVEAWVNEWLSRVPTGTCACQTHGREELGNCPILPSDAIDNQTLFAWGVRYHNAINARLGKPKMSYDAALVRWSIE